MNNKEVEYSDISFENFKIQVENLLRIENYYHQDFPFLRVYKGKRFNKQFYRMFLTPYLFNLLNNLIERLNYFEGNNCFVCMNQTVKYEIEADCLLINYKDILFNKVNFIFINYILPKIIFELDDKCDNIIFINCKHNNSENELIGITSIKLNNLVFFECEFNIVDIYNAIINKLEICISVIKNLFLTNNYYIEHIFLTRKSKLNNIKVNDSSVNNFQINNEVIINEINITNCGLLNAFEVTSNCEIRVINFSDLLETCNSLYFYNSIIKGMSIINSNYKEVIICDNSSLENFELVVSAINRLVISKSSISGDINLTQKVKIECVIINQNSRVNNIRLGNHSISVSELLIYDNCTIDKLSVSIGSNLGLIEVISSKINNIALTGLSLNLICKDAEFGNVEIDKCNFNRLEFHGILFATYFKIIETKITLFAIRNALIKKDSIIDILGSRFVFIYIVNTIIEGRMFLRSASSINKVLENITVIDDYPVRVINKFDLKYIKKVIDIRNSFYIVINSSSIGESEITNCDFSNFTILFKDSKISDLHFINNKLPGIPKSYKLNKSTKKLNNRISLFSQLRDLYLKAGDIEKVTKYHSEVLELNRKRLNRIKANFFTEECFTKIQFWLNSVSNGFGLSWKKALVFTLGVGFLFYTIFYVCYFIEIGLDSRFNVEFDFSYKNVQNSVLDYFRFLDLTHNLDNFKSINSNKIGFALIFDFLGRIFISYGIFQFIAAFRRHGVKK